ncbi:MULTISPECIES: hypothetical protein [unclassified Enterococcus]|uniref:hypothetical protein n=1 Tax=unclassified Enterococcus TaxID=2608891 RepID=UPI0015519B6D|nr:MULTISPECIES: hypothetical protein [unclassified Enterococcus]MBS7577162.1 hypothetical protein [Enterococcus sp. MMGLQ5-2]MBS7584391.1 hypothetical protein [Enterococcus sp. MMGLQ5-1]NPD12246.1 hypothetical protein [Enterococcus sp. MMGLQ5-1]NPD36996.1 hypothetical protein [Enterococcus sp. MMGLQ5-2]
MYKTEYDELRIKGILDVLQHDYPRSTCAEKIKNILNFYAGKSTNSFIYYALNDLECFLEIFPAQNHNNLLWYKSLSDEMTYEEGKKYFLDYLSTLEDAQDLEYITPKPHLFNFYQRWVKVNGYKFEIKVIYNVAYSYTLMKEIEKDNYFINIEQHRGAASGSLDYKLNQEDNKILKSLLEVGNKKEINHFIKEKYPTVED